MNFRSNQVILVEKYWTPLNSLAADSILELQNNKNIVY